MTSSTSLRIPISTDMTTLTGSHTLNAPESRGQLPSEATKMIRELSVNERTRERERGERERERTCVGGVSEGERERERTCVGGVSEGEREREREPLFLRLKIFAIPSEMTPYTCHTRQPLSLSLTLSLSLSLPHSSSLSLSYLYGEIPRSKSKSEEEERRERERRGYEDVSTPNAH